MKQISTNFDYLFFDHFIILPMALLLADLQCIQILYRYYLEDIFYKYLIDQQHFFC